MNPLFRILSVLVLFLFSMNAHAQMSAGDKLFSQGQKLQMVQTTRSQRQAIEKFTAAKKAYDSADKKTMCDNQIQICRNNIAFIVKKEEEAKAVVVNEEVKEEVKQEEQPQEKDPVSLSLSVSSVEFKSKGKKDDNHEVTVNCNYDTWTYTAPEWISVTKNGNILTLTASKNQTGEERSAVFVVECEGTKAELMVYQIANFKLKSVIKKIK